MTCKICSFALALGHLVLNFVMLLDHVGNTILLGDPNETISERAARARDAGWRWARWFCDVLSFISRTITLGKVSRDHCAMAIDPDVRPYGRELFSWTRMSFNIPPLAEVKVVADEQTGP